MYLCYYYLKLHGRIELEFQSNISIFLKSYCKSFIISFLILFFGIAILRKISKILVLFWQKTNLSLNIVKILDYLIKFILYFTIIALVLNQFGFNIWALLAPISASIIALSVVLKESLTDFISGIFIVLNQSVHIGDQIEFSHVRGKVIQIGYFCTTLQMEDGRTAVIPNSKITSEILIRKSEWDMSSIKLNLKIRYRSGANLKGYSKDLQNLKVMLEGCSLMYINDIIKIPPPELHFVSIDKHEAYAKFVAWTSKNNVNQVTESLSSLIKNKATDFSIDLLESEDASLHD